MSPPSEALLERMTEAPDTEMEGVVKPRIGVPIAIPGTEETQWSVADVYNALSKAGGFEDFPTTAEALRAEVETMGNKDHSTLIHYLRRDRSKIDTKNPPTGFVDGQKTPLRPLRDDKDDKCISRAGRLPFELAGDEGYEAARAGSFQQLETRSAARGSQSFEELLYAATVESDVPRMPRTYCITADDLLLRMCSFDPIDVVAGVPFIYPPGTTTDEAVTVFGKGVAIEPSTLRDGINNGYVGRYFRAAETVGGGRTTIKIEPFSLGGGGTDGEQKTYAFARALQDWSTSFPSVLKKFLTLGQIDDQFLEDVFQTVLNKLESSTQENDPTGTGVVAGLLKNQYGRRNKSQSVTVINSFQGSMMTALIGAAMADKYSLSDEHLSRLVLIELLRNGSSILPNSNLLTSSMSQTIRALKEARDQYTRTNYGGLQPEEAVNRLAHNAALLYRNAVSGSKYLRDIRSPTEDIGDLLADAARLSPLDLGALLTSGRREKCETNPGFQQKGPTTYQVGIDGRAYDDETIRSLQSARNKLISSASNGRRIPAEQAFETYTAFAEQAGIASPNDAQTAREGYNNGDSNGVLAFNTEEGQQAFERIERNMRLFAHYATQEEMYVVSDDRTLIGFEEQSGRQLGELFRRFSDALYTLAGNPLKRIVDSVETRILKGCASYQPIVQRLNRTNEVGRE